jgi:hypothetical protein
LAAILACCRFLGVGDVSHADDVRGRGDAREGWYGWGAGRGRGCAMGEVGPPISAEFFKRLLRDGRYAQWIADGLRSGRLRRINKL